MQMDFYLATLRFLTDLAVNAKSCLNSNVAISYKIKKASLPENYVLGKLTF